MLDKRTERFRQEYQGKHFMTKDGLTEFYISDARTYGDVTITFIPSGITKVTKVGNIKAGIPSPFMSIEKNYCPICFDNQKDAYIGAVYKTNSGEYIRIIGYETKDKVTYEFYNDPNHYIGTTTLQNIRKGQVRNPYNGNCVGGYLGENSEYRSDKYKWLKTIWYNINYRTDPEKLKTMGPKEYSRIEYYRYTKTDEIWKNYSNFAKWYMDHINQLNPNVKYNVDKDLLYPYYAKTTNGYKVYSPYTCVLLPEDINRAMANWNINCVKELYVKFNQMVEYYYSIGAISKDTYCILRRFYLNDPKYVDYITIKKVLFERIEIKED